jgi:hypothetical protein
MAAEEEGRGKGLRPVNDNGLGTGESIDPRILRIAEAIGRQLAREQARPPAAANDTNHGHDRDRFFIDSFIYLARLHGRRSDSWSETDRGGVGGRRCEHAS